MAAIGSGSLILSVNGAKFDSELKAAGQNVGRFTDKASKELKTFSAQGLKNTAEGLGRVQAAMSGIQNLDFSNPVSGMMSLKSAIELTALSAKSLKGALISTGIGALLVGAGALISFLSSRRAAASAASAATASSGPAVELSPMPGVTAALRDRLSGAWGGMRGRMAGAGGATEDELTLAAGRTEVARHAAIPGFDPRSADMMRRTLLFMTEDFRRLESATRLTGLRDLAEGIRDTTATMGMSAFEAELYRASLTRVATTVDGVTTIT
ncbi:MAG: hypothetical protein IAF94_16805, partial [Pirellulaceae bacterium]|nr:hypothetical protein [Pirellulaceae bacterium]